MVLGDFWHAAGHQRQMAIQQEPVLRDDHLVARIDIGLAQAGKQFVGAAADDQPVGVVNPVVGANRLDQRFQAEWWIAVQIVLNAVEGGGDARAGAKGAFIDRQANHPAFAPPLKRRGVAHQRLNGGTWRDHGHDGFLAFLGPSAAPAAPITDGSAGRNCPASGHRPGPCDRRLRHGRQLHAAFGRRRR